MIGKRNILMAKMNLKTTLIILFLIFTSSHVWSQKTIDSSRIVRVLTFNILHGATTKGDFDLDKIAKVIIDSKPDFVALQEVDFMTNRAMKYDLVKELGWRTQLVSLFARAMYYDDGEYGEGVLTSYSLLTSRNVSLPYSDGNEPRSALEIVTMIDSMDTIAFIGTHLDHTNDQRDRIIQVKKINEIFSSNRYPTILAGDLNAEPESTPIVILEEMWTASYKKDTLLFTYPSNNPVKKIDYIMYYPEDRWRVLETRVIADTIASDHCAYLVILELLNE